MWCMKKYDVILYSRNIIYIVKIHLRETEQTRDIARLDISTYQANRKDGLSMMPEAVKRMPIRGCGTATEEGRVTAITCLQGYKHCPGLDIISSHTEKDHFLVILRDTP